MTVKEILEKTEFGKRDIMAIKDYNITDLRPVEDLLEGYKKAFRKNAAYRYREIKALLDREAVVIKNTYCNFNDYYYITTRRSFEGAFSKSLDEYEKIILE